MYAVGFAVGFTCVLELANLILPKLNYVTFLTFWSSNL